MKHVIYFQKRDGEWVLVAPNLTPDSGPGAAAGAFHGAGASARWHLESVAGALRASLAGTALYQSGPVPIRVASMAELEADLRSQATTSEVWDLGFDFPDDDLADGLVDGLVDGGGLAGGGGGFHGGGATGGRDFSDGGALGVGPVLLLGRPPCV